MNLDHATVLELNNTIGFLRLGFRKFLKNLPVAQILMFSLVFAQQVQDKDRTEVLPPLGTVRKLNQY